MDIVTTFRRAVTRHGDRPFLVDTTGQVSYREADERTDAFAAELVARGLEVGDTVGCCAADRISLWLAIIGAWKAGVLPGLIDARTGPEQLPYFVEDVGAPLVVAAVERHDALREAGADAVIDIDALGEVPHDAVDRHGPDAPLYLSYTSGTTGPPKGAILRSEPVTLGTACIADRLQLGRDDVLLATTPTASSFQLVGALMPAVHVGAAVALASGRPVPEMWDVARSTDASVLVAYPLTLADVVNGADATADGPFRIALSGGSPLAPRLKRDYREVLGIDLLESYGQSELGGFMAMGSPADGSRSLEGFVGRSLPDRLAFVGGADGSELPAGSIGEVMVGSGFFPEYRNKPDRYADATRGGVLRTGDLAVADDDGYLKVLGRTGERDRAAERGGFLRELEDACYDHEAVRHAAVVETDDGRVAAFVELGAGATATVDEVAGFARDAVSPGLAPAHVSILERMPRTFSGKADRMGLAAAASAAR